MRGLVFLLALSACTQTGEEQSTEASESWLGPFGPLPLYSVEYRAPFQPFTLCTARELARKLTVKVAYDQEGRLARLVAYETVLDRRFVYELDLRRKPNDVVLVELSVGSFSKLRSWRSEVDRVLKDCEAEVNGGKLVPV